MRQIKIVYSLGSTHLVVKLYISKSKIIMADIDPSGFFGETYQEEQKRHFRIFFVKIQECELSLKELRESSGTYACCGVGSE